MDLTGAPQYKVKLFWSKCLQDQKENWKLLCSNKALVLAYLVHVQNYFLETENYKIYRKNSKIWDTSNNCHNCPKIGKV